VSFYYQSGEGFNLLARAAAVNTPALASATADTNYPVANAYDGRPSHFAKIASLSGDPSLTFDLNLIYNGDAAGSTFTGWTGPTVTSGSGTLTQYSSSPYSGANSCRMNLTGGSAGANTIAASYPLRLRAGEKARLYYAGWIITGTNVKFWLVNQDNATTLTSGGAFSGWAAAVTVTSTSWTSGYIDFTVPDAETGGGLWQRITLYVEANVTSGTTIDAKFEVKLVPGWDTVVVAGHSSSVSAREKLSYQALSANDPGDSFSSGTSPDSSTAYVKAAGTAGQSYIFPATEYNEPVLWNKLSTTRYERWVRFTLFSDVSAWTALPMYGIGELILCQAETLPINPRIQFSLAYGMTGQTRVDTGSGDQWVYNRAAIPQRRMTLRYATQSSKTTGADSSFRTISRHHIERTHGGAHYSLVIPYEHDSRMAIYGRMSGTLSLEHVPGQRTFEVEILESPMPSVSHLLASA
jgi:hypothetical protein